MPKQIWIGGFWVAALASVSALLACSSSTDTSPGTTSTGGTGEGGTRNGAAGAHAAGAGAAPSNGGASSAGATSVGGSTPAGGAGAIAGSGGAPHGGAPGSGGISNGGAPGSGGTPSTGGTSGVGGAAGIGGAAGAGGSSGVASCLGASATELNLVSGWLQNTDAAAKGALPAYAYSNIKSTFPAGAAFDQLACAIAMTCVEFAPMESNWLRKCEAVITSAIVAESSYNPKSVVVDTYATRAVGNVTANDPTVGLLQIRFTSTVHDYNYYGSVAKMAAIGCAWPAALASQADTGSWWATNGGTTYLSFMQDVSCNVALAGWYYFYNATGNGGASAVYISDYCAGHGTAGTMVDGLLSHLMGGSYPRPADANNAYPWGIECCAAGNPSNATCTGCTGRFAAFMGIGTSNARPSPDPFQESLAPEVAKYCK